MVRFIAAICAIVWLVPLQASIADNLNIYTHRQPTLLEPILKAYTKKTGVTFSTVYAPKGLVQRLQAEGDATPADMVITVDINRVHELSETGLLASLSSPKIEKQVPAHLRDKSDEWTALSLRARIAAVSIQRVEKSEVLGLADLVKPAMKGRVCTRVGSHVYNRALLASIIANDGEAAARAWARGLIENLARKPQGNDRAQAKAIYSGECDVALMNTYYYGKMKFNEKNPEQKNWANSLRLVFLDQNGRGQHVNISAAAILKASKKKTAALEFIEWLTSPEAQLMYTEVNYEYPVNPEVNPSNEVASWGKFKIDEVSLTDIAKNTPLAQMIINETGW
tara:strand:+ start:52 stop:1065 length:1014 start_codon:yes stop_codon:yes gene_type:complete